MTNFSDVRIFFCTTPTNMSYSFDSLMGQAQEVFDQDPLSGHRLLFDLSSLSDPEPENKDVQPRPPVAAHSRRAPINQGPGLLPVDDR